MKTNLTNIRALNDPDSQVSTVVGAWSRRDVLVAGVAVCALSLVGRAVAATLSAPKPGMNATVTIENFTTASASAGSAEVPKVVKSDDEWRKQLSRQSYQVTRHEGTEPAFSGEYASNHADGLYHCICCDTVLFDSKTKFESGTGWPSFYQPLQNAVGERKDSTLGMVRTEIHCRRCGGHLGHVFDDGPKPTGLRYCMDGFALVFHPAAPSAS